MSSDTDQDAGRSVLSWESVVDADPAHDTPPAPAHTTPSPAPSASPSNPAASVEPHEVALPPIDLAIAPLTLDPLPTSHDVSATRPEPPPPVLGGFHLDLNAISASVDTITPASPEPTDLTPIPDAPVAPAAAVTPSVQSTIDSLELKIAPLDMPDLTPTGASPRIDPAPTPAPAAFTVSSEIAVVPSAEHATIAPTPISTPTPISAPTPAAAPTAVPGPASTGEVARIPASQSTSPAPAASIPGLPTDAVSADHTPTTVIPGVFEGQIAPPALPGTDPGSDSVTNVAVVTVPEYHPSQAVAPRVAAVRPRAAHVPDPAVPRNQTKQKQQKKQQKLQKKHQKSGGGGGGIALFFTLLVLVGIIVGAIVFGRPYLFPDDWDLDAKPYGEAVEIVRGTEIAQPLLIDRVASATFGVSMADHLLGDWEAELPMWRSLALVKGPIDAPALRELVANWSSAYYSPETSKIIANADLLPGAVDGAVTEAMALAAIDQETAWSSQLDPSALDASALAEANVIAESQRVSGSTSFGAGLNIERRIDVAAFLPPVLEYRINAPQAYAEFGATGTLETVSSDLLTPSREPELVDGDTIVTSQIQMDRAFWYMVFASYNTPVDAYDASNAIVQSSLAIVDRAGVQCSYATFSGSDLAGTEQLVNVLGSWAAIAPLEMAATSSSLADGTLQLTSCDPGPGFDSSARFGVARELARWRSVELAAMENVDPQSGTAADRDVAVQQVRESHAALPMMDQPFDTRYAESARMARAVVFTADGSLDTAPESPESEPGATLEAPPADAGSLAD